MGSPLITATPSSVGVKTSVLPITETFSVTVDSRATITEESKLRCPHCFPSNSIHLACTGCPDTLPAVFIQSAGLAICIPYASITCELFVLNLIETSAFSVLEDSPDGSPSSRYETSVISKMVVPGGANKEIFCTSLSLRLLQDIVGCSSFIGFVSVVVKFIGSGVSRSASIQPVHLLSEISLCGTRHG